MQSRPAHPTAPLIELPQAAQAIFARPGATRTADYYFNDGIQSACARHALAETMIGMLRGEHGTGDLVAVATGYMRSPPVAHVLVEAYVAGFLFAAWSTIENIVFAANALGLAARPSGGFEVVTDKKALKRIGPAQLISPDPKKLSPAYPAHLPRLHAAFLAHVGGLRRLQAQHNASKHRSSTMLGGDVDLRAFPPEQHERMFQRVTWQRILLNPIPEDPIAMLDPHAKPEDLEDLAKDWRSALYEIGAGLAADVTALR